MAKYKVFWGREGKKSFFRDGEPITEAEYDAACPSKIGDLLKSKDCLAMSASASTWADHGSFAMGVNPDQVPQAMETDRKLGVPTSYTADGQPIMRDRQHRKAFLRAHGKRDNQGGYGD